MSDAPDGSISENKTAMNEETPDLKDQVIESENKATSENASVSENGESPLLNQKDAAVNGSPAEINLSNIEIQSADQTASLPNACDQSNGVQSDCVPSDCVQTDGVSSSSEEKESVPPAVQMSDIVKSDEALQESPESDANNSETNNSDSNESEDSEESEDLKESENDDSVVDTRSLSEVLDQYNIKLSAKKIHLLEIYCQELWKINEHLNLTRHTNYEKFVTLDLIDAIHLADQLQKGEHILDVGTGGGMPGVLLAILRPDITVELCDSTRKKAEALGTILDAMDLTLNVWYAKGENLLKVHRFHTIVIRAVSRLEKLLRAFSAVWFAFDRMLLIKGHQWVAERGEARHYNLLNNIALRKVDEYMNPGLDNPSVILQLCQKKRFEELKKREADRLEGKPIESQPEMIGVETGFAPREKQRGFAHKRPFSNRSNGSGRSSERSRRSDSETGERSRDKNSFSKERKRFSEGEKDSGHGEGASTRPPRTSSERRTSSSASSSGDHFGSEYKKPFSGSSKFSSGKRGSSFGSGKSESENSGGETRRSSGGEGKRSFSDHKSKSGNNRPDHHSGNRSGAPKRSFKEGRSGHQSND